MEDGGFKKKNGCLGRALFSSLTWSLGFGHVLARGVGMKGLGLTDA